MKTIIVPVDFSNTSVNAAYYAADIAQQIHADIILLHVLALPIIASEVPLPAESCKIAQEEAKDSLQQIKEKIDNYCNDKLSITYRTTFDSFLDEIEGFNQQHDLFAVIMGTNGSGAAEAFFLGSFSLAAAKHLHYPLIVVPPGYQFKPIEKVGLACDMKNVLDHIPIKDIRAVFDNFKAKLVILYVSKPTEKMYPEVLRESKFMQICLVQYRPEIRIITNDDIKEGLEDFAHKAGIDLLLLLPKERNFPDNIFHKSITKKMVLQPRMPVMIVHN